MSRGAHGNISEVQSSLEPRPPPHSPSSVSPSTAVVNTSSLCPKSPVYPTVNMALAQHEKPTGGPGMSRSHTAVPPATL
eukprot:scaffold149404_cov20-Tisochrysis_lutea.AAC.3